MPVLTPAVRRAIVEAVQAGAHPEVAAREAGVDARTFSGWLDRGRSPAPSDRTRRYRELAAEVDRAEASCERRMVEIARGSDAKESASALAFLERRFPERWARRMGRPPNQTEQAAPEPRSVVDELAARRRTS